ncbi:MAG: tetratricopeptide repeat protein [Candidatus Krumholzibacteria bacterium]|nr:tetratricopeptide repeat protein [Candidatus Krumholzibacteria bacterium]
MPRARASREPAPLAPRIGLVVGAAAVACLIVGVASFLPAARLWGLNHLAFYPLPVRFLALALVAVTFVPAVARALYASLAGAIERLSAWRWGVAAIAAAAVAAVAAFFFLRSATNLLGDGQLIAQSFIAAHEGNKDVVMRSVPAILREEPIAPGATLFFYWSAQASAKLFGGDPITGMRVFTCLLGGLLVFLLLRLARDAPTGPGLRVWLLVLGLSSCTLELFFGYIENYAALVFLLALYTVGAFRVMHGQRSLGWCVALLAVAGYTHIQGLLFAPSLALLVLWRLLRGRRRAILDTATPILAALTVAATVAGAWTGYGKHYLPLRATADAQGMFSLAHLVDMANEMLMLLPALPVLLAMAWLGRGFDRTLTDADKKRLRREADAGAWFMEPIEWRFVGLILLPCSLYLLVFNPEIGMARDWDLFTMVSVALVPLFLLVLNRYVTFGAVPGDAVARFAAPSLALSLVLGGAWFGINASPWRTAERFERILHYDESHASYAYENLAVFYHDMGALQRAMALLERTTERYGNPRQFVRLALYYEEMGWDGKAIDLLYRVLEGHAGFDKALFKLLTLLEKKDRWAEVESVARAGVEHHPREAVYPFYLGQALVRAGRTEEAMESFRTCLTLNPPPAARAYIDRVLSGETPAP